MREEGGSLLAKYRDEIERLMRERDAAREHTSTAAFMRLEAERDRLRAALERITELEIPLGISKPMPATAFAEAKAIAHKALSGATSAAVEPSAAEPYDPCAPRTDERERMGWWPRKAVETSDGWRPIETAPPDGRAVLITDGAYIAEAWRRGDKWEVTCDGYVFEDACHWMPIPGLPKRPPDEGITVETLDPESAQKADARGAYSVRGETVGHIYSPREGTDVCFICGFHKREHAPEHMPPESSVKASERPLTLLDFGYAPGVYAFHCLDCDQEDIGDKRAIRCKTCAQKALSAQNGSGESA